MTVSKDMSDMSQRLAQEGALLRKLNRPDDAMMCDVLASRLRMEADKLRMEASKPLRSYPIAIRVEAEAIFMGWVNARNVAEALTIARKDESAIKGVNWNEPDDITTFDARTYEILYETG